jgi:hypothetical protein
MPRFRFLSRRVLALLTLIGACVLAGCGGTNFYTIGGIVSGLPEGSSVILVDNGTDFLTVSASGSFVFAVPIAYGGSYSVSVFQNPVGYTCAISGDTGAGTNVTSDVSSVSVVCSQGAYTIGGTVSGLPSGGSVTLTNNATDVLTVSVNGGFTFATPVAYGGSYDVAVSQSPDGYTCSAGNNIGTNVTASVSTVAVVCTPTP